MPGKTCSYQDCDQSIAPWLELCQEHNADKQSGLIDQCPDCGQYKDPRYPLCRHCNAGARSPAPKNTPSRRRSKYDLEENPEWDRGDADAEEFFAYILKLSNGGFYAGHTREIRERLDEHRDGDVIGTAGKNPKLVWFTRAQTRHAVAEAEQQLKWLIDNNPREIRRMVFAFQDMIKLVDTGP